MVEEMGSMGMLRYGVLKGHESMGTWLVTWEE